MKKKFKVEFYKKTCDACPSQWEIFIDDGHTLIYARYRYGHISLTLNRQETIFSMDVGDELDGTMSTEELMQLTKDVLDWSNAEDLRLKGKSSSEVNALTTGNGYTAVL